MARRHNEISTVERGSAHADHHLVGLGHRLFDVANFGTGPSHLRSAPWQAVHAVILPLPVVTRASPFLTLPGGTKAMKPDRGLRRSSVSSTLTGVSMMRSPIGSMPASAPVTGKNIPPAGLVFGTGSLSTTLVQGGGGVGGEYFSGGLDGSLVLVPSKSRRHAL